MHARHHVFDDMSEYEVCLANARRLHRRLREAQTDDERRDAQREYDAALDRARTLGARLTRELDRAARAA